MPQKHQKPRLLETAAIGALAGTGAAGIAISLHSAGESAKFADELTQISSSSRPPEEKIEAIKGAVKKHQDNEKSFQNALIPASPIGGGGVGVAIGGYIRRRRNSHAAQIKEEQSTPAEPSKS